MSGIMTEEVDKVITFYRPYTVEDRRLRSLCNFRVISEYFYKSCLKEFKDREHKEAIKINEEMN